MNGAIRIVTVTLILGKAVTVIVYVLRAVGGSGITVIVFSVIEYFPCSRVDVWIAVITISLVSRIPVTILVFVVIKIIYDGCRCAANGQLYL